MTVAQIPTLSESLEDYLEAILHIVAEKQAARAKDIAERLGVSNASVTSALHSLSEKKLVNHAPYDIVTLTREGNEIAEGIVRRHEALRDFFVKVLAVDEKEAEECACKMEHSVPDNVLERFISFLEFAEGCPPVAEWSARESARSDGGEERTS
ncbi:MAG: metal-dependent transcriptional regulator [Kiritimatiellae bacterium]|nr:metal-dependent transcriptional regulator [Kiritimatiellia bacterium]